MLSHLESFADSKDAHDLRTGSRAKLRVFESGLGCGGWITVVASKWPYASLFLCSLAFLLVFLLSSLFLFLVLFNDGDKLRL